jgi:hypothetical protein
MRTHTFAALLIGMGAVNAINVSAADDSSDEPGKYRLNGVLAFNISAKFSNLGGFLQQTAIGPAAGHADRFYDDGFNRVDASGLADGKTWFWGYQNASQGGPGAAAINMHSSSSTPTLVSPNNSNDPSPGFDLSYLYRMQKLSGGEWGFSLTFNYLNIDIKDNQTLLGDVSVITDSFATGSAAPAIPPAPYNGPGAGAAGPGPRIDNIPTRTTASVIGGALTTGYRELDGSLFTLKIGPYIDYSLTKNLKLEFNAGLAVGLLNNEYRYNENTTILGIGPVLAPGVVATQNLTGSATKTSILPGGYVGVLLDYAVTKQFDIFVGGQYQYLGTFDQTVNGRQAKLDFTKTALVQAGIGFTF